MNKIFLFLFFSLSSMQLSANVNGVDSQIFKPTPDGLDFITLHSTQTLPPWHMNVGLFLNGASDTFVLTEARQNVNSRDFLFTSDVSAAFGLWDRLSLGFNIPIILGHSSSESVPGLYFSENGMLELSVSAKYTILTRGAGRNYGLAIIPSVNIPFVEDPYFNGDKKNLIFNLEGAWDYQFDESVIGFNLGYRIKNPENSTNIVRPFDPIDDQILASVGYTYFSEKLSTGFTGEIYMGSQADNFFKEIFTPMEILFTAKYNPKVNLSLAAGSAFGLTRSLGNPEFRFFTGVNFYFGLGTMTVDYRDVQARAKLIENFRRGQKLVISLPERMVFFNFDRHELLDESKKVLDILAKAIRKNRQIRSIVIEGHTDSIGGDEYNMLLSERRARSVHRYLAPKSGRKSIFSMRFKGEKAPIASNLTFAGRAQNRRVQFVIH